MHNAALFIGSDAVANRILHKRLHRKRRDKKLIAFNIIFHLQPVAVIIAFQIEICLDVFHFLLKGNHFRIADRIKMRAQILGEIRNAAVKLRILPAARTNCHQRIIDKMRLYLRNQYLILALLQGKLLFRELCAHLIELMCLLNGDIRPVLFIVHKNNQRRKRNTDIIEADAPIIRIHDKAAERNNRCRDNNLPEKPLHFIPVHHKDHQNINKRQNREAMPEEKELAADVLILCIKIVNCACKRRQHQQNQKRNMQQLKSKRDLLQQHSAVFFRNMFLHQLQIEEGQKRTDRKI